jgi:molybdenum cofactor cytidylyltransferase
VSRAPVAIVLAAGSARRFGSDKLSATFQGEPLLHHAIRAALAAPVDRVIVVGSPAMDIGDWPVDVVRIASTALSDSLKAGIAAARDAAGAFIFLGDMPLIPHDIAARLAAAIGDQFAAIPHHRGTNGHPVLLSARAFPEIARLEGDKGAGALIKQHTDIAFIDVASDAILLDIDSKDDLDRLQGRP